MWRHVGEGTRTWCESMGIHLSVHHVERHSRQTAPALSTREEARRVPWRAARPERCAPRLCGLPKSGGSFSRGGAGGLSAPPVAWLFPPPPPLGQQPPPPAGPPRPFL